MAYYFSVPHLGAGSLNVESLGCYFLRLAHAHGCSQWQLARHLAAWWDHMHGKGTKSRFLKTSVAQNSLAMLGYGEAVSKLVSALTLATGISTLRSGTLLSLQEAAAHNSIGTLRTTRAWCPACYEEDAKEGRDVYDRLVWAIAPIKRCAGHKIALMDRCPVCNSTQLHLDHCSDVDRCGSCGHSLLGRIDARVVVDQPTLGEKLILDMVAASALDPTLTLNRQCMRAFFKRYRRELPKGDPLLTMPSLTSASMRPTLETIVRMATAFDVSLLDFQTAQPPSINRSLYPPKSLPFEVRLHGRLPSEVGDRVARALNEVLTVPDTPPPFAAFCQNLGVSTGYVVYRFPVLAKTYAERRRNAGRVHQRILLKAARMAAEAGLINDYITGRISQKRQLVHAIAGASGVSIVMARKVVAMYQDKLAKRECLE